MFDKIYAFILAAVGASFGVYILLDEAAKNIHFDDSVKERDRQSSCRFSCRVNVLDGLEPSMLNSLLATVIIERICGDLASALADVAGDRRCLKQVEHRPLLAQVP